jgi:hypothetical protein
MLAHLSTLLPAYPCTSVTSMHEFAVQSSSGRDAQPLMPASSFGKERRKMASDVDFGPLGMPPVAAGGGGGAGGGVGAGGGSTATGVAGEGTGGAGDRTAAVAFGREAAPSATPAPSRFRASMSCRQVSAAAAALSEMTTHLSPAQRWCARAPHQRTARPRQRGQLKSAKDASIGIITNDACGARRSRSGGA